MHNGFVFDGKHGVRAYIRKFWGIDVEVLFIGAISKILFNRVFILPISDLAFPTFHVAMTSLNYDTKLVFFMHIYLQKKEVCDK